MSIQSEINRIKASIAESYNAVSEMGGEIPEAEETRTINMLPAAIRTVSPPNLPAGVTLVSLGITSTPTKTEYQADEIFDPSGLILTAEFSNSVVLQLEYPFPNQVSFDPAGPLEAGLEYITIGFTWGDVVENCTLPVTVASKYEAGVDWWAVTTASTGSWQHITYGNGKFVVVYNDRTLFECMYSTDGIKWTRATLPTAKTWDNITYGGGKFVVVDAGYGGVMADYGTKVAYSTDGITWKTASLPMAARWGAIAYGSDKFVVITAKETSTSIAAYSTDGITWKKVTLPHKTYWGDITYGNGKFVAVEYGSDSSAYSNDTVAYSTDGITWKTSKLPFAARWISVAYGNGKFVAVSGVNDADTIAYSTDGITWKTASLPFASRWSTVAYGNGKFVAIHYNADNAPSTFTDTAIYSTDGINWKTTALPHTAKWSDIAYGDGKFIISEQSAPAVINGSSGTRYGRYFAYSSDDGPPTLIS